MKTLEEVQAECFGDVFTLEKFMEYLDNGYFISYDGNGYFHDGEKETDISVWDPTLTWDDVKNYPYVTWYNR